jgi:hypothetical protein
MLMLIAAPYSSLLPSHLRGLNFEEEVRLERGYEDNDQRGLPY